MIHWSPAKYAGSCTHCDYRFFRGERVAYKTRRSVRGIRVLCQRCGVLSAGSEAHAAEMVVGAACNARRMGDVL